MTDLADEEYEEVIRAHVEESWNEGNYEHLKDHYAIDVSVIQFGKSYQGRDQVRELIEEHRDGFSNLQMEIDDIAITNLTTTFHWTFSGTHSGIWYEMEPTGTEVDFSSKSTMKFCGNKISSVHGLPDRLSILRELGTLI